MTWLRVIVTRISALFGQRRLDAELDEELRFHLEMEERDNVRRGMSAEAACRQARLRLGGLEQVKETYRERRGIPFVASILQDLRFAVRSFGKDRGWTGTVLATLTLGIGVSTATFSVVNAVLLNPLPYKDPDRVVMLWAVNDEAGLTLDHQRERIGSLSPVELQDWKEKRGAALRRGAGISQRRPGCAQHSYAQGPVPPDPNRCQSSGSHSRALATEGRCGGRQTLRPGSRNTAECSWSGVGNSFARPACHTAALHVRIHHRRNPCGAAGRGCYAMGRVELLHGAGHSDLAGQRFRSPG